MISGKGKEKKEVELLNLKQVRPSNHQDQTYCYLLVTSKNFIDTMNYIGRPINYNKNLEINLLLSLYINVSRSWF